MGFIQSGYLAALAAIAIPVVIHLVFFRRTQKVELGTLRFLKVVLESNARRKKIKRWLLLCLRAACVALLALLFARPYLIARELSENNHVVVILVDRSASMTLSGENGRLLDQAVDAAKKVVTEFDEGTHIEFAFFDHRVHPLAGAADLAEANSDLRSSIAELTAPMSTHAATNYGAALAWARDICLKSAGGPRDVYIYTDLQRSGLDWSQAEPLPDNVVVHLIDLGRALPNNLAVFNAQPPQPIIRPGDSVTITPTIYNASPFPVEMVPVIAKIQNGRQERVLREQVKLLAGQVVEVPFEFTDVQPGLWEGTVELEYRDELTFDNLNYFAILSAPQIKVLLVDGAPQKSSWLSETYFLDAAISLASPGEINPDSPFQTQAQAYETGDADLPNLNDQQIVVLANVGELTRAAVIQLTNFVRQGGGLLIFTGNNVGPGLNATLQNSGIAAGKIQAITQATGLPWRIRHWKSSHPIFEPFNDPQHGDLTRMAFQSYTSLLPSPQATVLAAFQNGEPAVVEKRHDLGRVVWFLSAADRDWSDWSRSRLYLPLVHQMLTYLAGYADGGPVRHLLMDSLKAGPADEARDEQTPGVFRREGFHQVVNSSPRESETDRCSSQEFAERFGLNLSNGDGHPVAGKSQSPAPTTDLRDNEVWHWVVFAVLGMLMLESSVANRTAA